ncbi:MAG: type I restriction enzyme HsdR N-terminal domain-containing protein [Alistipes sp.]|nr:type I restriction enzyme HsdR N-terminal domain-containing protein [Alistipes sp.]
MEFPRLHFPPIRLRARRGANGRTEVFDRGRGRWLVLTPEEWVRRHVVEYLRGECGFLAEQIVEEYPVDVNGMAQRADIVAIGSDAKPLVIVECKEPNVTIDQETLRQAARYNAILGCRYLVTTNGLTTHCFMLSPDGGYVAIDHFPHFE